MFTIDVTRYSSPNFDQRSTPITYVVIHSCEGHPLGNEQASSIPWLCNPAAKVSSHYYVTREGKIYQLVAERYRAWHAGRCTIAADANSVSLGIELEHAQGAAPYPDIQKEALAWLCKQLMARYAIPADRVVSHRAIALPSKRKIDPTDWPEPAFRLWCAELCRV